MARKRDSACDITICRDTIASPSDWSDKCCRAPTKPQTLNSVGNARAESTANAQNTMAR
jgi:hypothetical protein